METINNPLSPDFSSLIKIVQELGEQVKVEMLTGLEVEEKDGKELVTHIDRLIELRARELIKQEFWAVNFLWEEFPDEDNWSDITFIIDPLDGTESFINQEFNTTISIWVKLWDKLVYGLVYDFMKWILYKGWEVTEKFIHTTRVPLLRQNYWEQIRVLVSWRGQDVEDIQARLREHPEIRMTRAYGSVALQTVQTGAWNYDWYVRAWKIKTWDIAWAVPFIQSLDDTSVLSREWTAFDFNNPESWIIVARNYFLDEFLSIINSPL